MLTKEQEMHLATVVEYATEALIAKYSAGAVEHQGLITDLSVDQLLQESINEAIDQVVYLVTLRQKLTQNGE